MTAHRFGAFFLSLCLLFLAFPSPAGLAGEAGVPAPEKAEGTRQLTLYWKQAGADYSRCDVWLWFPGRDGRGYPFEPCDYGVKCTISVPEDISQVGFIVRKNCSEPGGSAWGTADKDFGDDRFAVLTGADTEIYLLPGDGMQYTSPDGGQTLNPIRAFTLAGMISPTEIRYFITPACRLESLSQVHVRRNGQEMAVASLSSLGNKVITGIITLEEEMDLTAAITVEIDGYGEIGAVPTALFDSPAFTEKYTYDGDDLGAVLHGDHTVFKVWAPTASEVILNLYDSGHEGDARERIPMTREEKGVWTAQAACGHGTYYTYTVTTAVGTQEAVDPYARTVGVNGDRGMVTDLSLTDPEGFRSEAFTCPINSYQDAVIWEVHVRDFSNALPGSRYPGKYLAFTETGLTNAGGVPCGVDYLKNLGITHVHLQPVYDFATVDEASDEPQFNWGYDPKNYNAPEGSYSTDPFHGEVRIREFKQMVESLHENGIGVVMDMVYNHTYSLDSCLNRIVPYYYYRFNADGTASNGSGCGNETASERPMFRKYMVDSVAYWAREYHLDGFRFDLMALHDVETMQQIEAAVHAINPRALLYGEGWTGGDTPLRSDRRADQANIRKIQASGDGIGAVAVFNDAIRDGLKGSVFSEKDKGYANGNPAKGTAGKVLFGLQGGIKAPAVTWRVENAMLINYTSSHDNHTLWDKLTLTQPDAPEEDRLAMNRLCAAAVLLGKGIPFFLAGEEMLRSKGGDSNSYKSSDSVNNLRWEELTPDSTALSMSRFYGDLIRLRREKYTRPDSAFRFLTEGEASAEIRDRFILSVTWTLEGREVALAILNPYAEPLTEEMPEGWDAYQIAVRGDHVTPEADAQTGSFPVEPHSLTLILRR